MSNKEYIESGILELYVAGALSDKENEAVYNKLLQHPDILDEVIKIESAVQKLTAAAAPRDSKFIYTSLKEKLNTNNNDTKVVPLRKPNYMMYTGWAASILLLGGLIWLLNQNTTLKSDIRSVETEIRKRDIDNELLEIKIEKTTTNLVEAEAFISALRDRDIISVPLGGQAVYPEAYATVYWDKNSKQIFLDAVGLPEPPNGKVYQVWSLTLNPLTPTSLGTIDDFASDENKIFVIENANASEAFGITLEPAGGSPTPTMEQLYTLGAVNNSPS